MPQTLTYGSLFAGIGGFDLGFERAGLECRWQVEKDRDCLRVLGRHWPGVARVDDVARAGASNLELVDVVCFGSPCQDLSVAGRRAGLGGERSGLFFEAIRVVRELRPALAVWENVPGTFSSNAGRDFLAVLLAFRQLGARDIGWRSLDAQHFGLAQRRERVFLVADFGAERAGQVLFESPCGCRHSPPRREAGAGVAPSATPGARRASGDRSGEQLAYGGNNTAGPIDVATAVNACKSASGRQDFDSETFVTHASDRSPSLAETHPPAVAFYPTGGTHGVSAANDLSPSLKVGTGIGVPSSPAVAFCLPASSMGTGDGHGQGWNSNYLPAPAGVRRLMPVECCRLQGFPDDWLDLEPPLSDSAKYRMLGNAVAVPVAEWIGRRIAAAVGENRV